MAFTKDHTGKRSMMRVGFFTCLFVGAIIALSGTVGAFLNIGEATTLINSGTLLMGSSGFAKAIQAHTEHKNKGE